MGPRSFIRDSKHKGSTNDLKVSVSAMVFGSELNRASGDDLIAAIRGC
jgi:hypothetical protein